MDKEQYIRSKFRDILSETLEERVKGIEKNLKGEVSLSKTPNEFDYVQEGKKTCNECGGMMKEGECSECGMKGEVMELGGMEDGHPKYGDVNFSKLSRKDIEDLIHDVDSDLKKSHKKKRKNDDSEEIEFELEIDEDECKECDSSYEMKEKLYGKQHKLDKNKNGRLDKEDFKMLRKQQDEEEQLYEIEFVKEGEVSEKWEDDVEVKQTGEYSDMSIKELNAAIKKQKDKNDKVKDAGKKVSHEDKTKMSQLYFAKRAKQGWKGKGKAKVNESILYTESDLIDLIESLVIEETKKFKTSEPKGYKEYEKAHKADKKENDDYLKSIAKKMSDYLKPVSDEGTKYKMKDNNKFPSENGGLKKGIRKKYTPSQAVDDYNDAFSYPGQTNLRFDEIKPNKKNIEKYLKGHSTTGNAQVDKDGNALGNVVPSEVGDKFYQNFKNDYYGHEQADASYKRYSQPVDMAGDDTEEGDLKSKKGGKKTAKSILNKVDESANSKENKMLNEEFEKIQKLMNYNKKTQ